LAGLFDLSLLFALPTNATVTHSIKGGGGEGKKKKEKKKKLT